MGPGFLTPSIAGGDGRPATNHRLGLAGFNVIGGSFGPTKEQANRIASGVACSVGQLVPDVDATKEAFRGHPVGLVLSPPRHRLPRDT